MDSHNPFITTIVAVLNGMNTLERCINSILSQTYPYKELIVMDGGSTDGTVDILRAKDDKITYWESKPDRGIYHAWNKALEHTHGDWICFLGADDYFWNDNVLEDLQPHLASAKRFGIRVVHGKIARVDSNEKTIRRWGKPWEKNCWQMPHGMPLGMPHTGLMHYKDLFREHGLFDHQLKLAGDYEFLLRELKHKDRRTFFVKELVTVAQQVGGATDSHAFRFHQEVAIARKKHGLPKFSWLWWLIHMRAFIRQKLMPSRY